MRRRDVLALAVMSVMIPGLAARPLVRDLRAAALLARFANPSDTGRLAAFARHEVDERDWSFPLGAASIPARLYLPRDRDDAPALVLVHGVHPLGIDEPRLRRFARAFAGAGVAVMTPEVAGLAAFRIEADSLETIGAACAALRAWRGRPVGLMGLSFAGGLALLAAADARVAPEVAYVVAVGAHDDLLRVLRFYATGEAPRPDGGVDHLKPHDYGPAVLVYSHAEDFFAPLDLPVARSALAAWLHEDEPAARAAAAKLSGGARQLVGSLMDRDVHAITAPLLEELARPEARPVTAAVSPHGRLSGLTAPTFLLHGAGDVVVPAAETRWLAREVPAAALRDVLVSPALVHVELGVVSRLDELRLVHFLGGVLAEAEAGAR